MNTYAINDYFEYQFSVQDPDTGAVSNADELPTYTVLKSGSEDIIATGTCDQRSSIIGYYYARNSIDSPKYSVDSDYNVRVLATISGTTGSSRIGDFRVVSEDKTRKSIWEDSKADFLDVEVSSRLLHDDTIYLLNDAINDIFDHNVQTYSATGTSVGSSLKAAWAQGFGEWKIVGHTLILYGPDSTVVRTFALNNSFYPIGRTPA